MLNLLQEFKGYGCQVVSVSDGIPLDGPFGEIIVAAIAMCAGMEREAISNRVASARARVEASGGSWGRPSVLDDAKRERIGNMKAKGYSVRKIARLVKVSTSTVFDHLKRVGAVSGKPTPKRSVKTPPKKALTSVDRRPSE
jgi:DNA invertase Pin-like site-specific DNA recombinase